VGLVCTYNAFADTADFVDNKNDAQYFNLDGIGNVPLKVNGFVTGEPIYYETGSGASLSYQTVSKPSSTVTFYAYDLGYKNIKDGIDTDVVIDEFNNSKKYKEYFSSLGIYKNIKNIKDGKKTIIIDSRNKIDALYASDSYDIVSKKGAFTGPVISDIYLFGFNKKICKIRVTRQIGADEREVDRCINEVLLSLIGKGDHGTRQKEAHDK
jgi:hypothetical protein